MTWFAAYCNLCNVAVLASAVLLVVLSIDWNGFGGGMGGAA